MNGPQDPPQFIPVAAIPTSVWRAALETPARPSEASAGSAILARVEPEDSLQRISDNLRHQLDAASDFSAITDGQERLAAEVSRQQAQRDGVQADALQALHSVGATIARADAAAQRRHDQLLVDQAHAEVSAERRHRQSILWVRLAFGAAVVGILATVLVAQL